MNRADFVKALANGQELPEANTNRYVRLSDRLYEITGFNGKGETKVRTNVTAQARRGEIRELRREGFGRVNCIEISTTVNEKIGKEIRSRKLEFARQTFAAANNKAIPAPIVVETPETTQATIPWEIVDEKPNAWLDNRPIVKVADRNAKVKVERKRIALVNKENIENNSADRMQIFDRKTQGFLFGSTDENAIAQYIQSNKLKLEDIIVYVPNEIYWMLVEMEK